MFSLPKESPLMMVEDNDDDYEATLRAFKASGISMDNSHIIRFDNGEDALSYLHRRDQYAAKESSPRPGVILLDLNMPGIGGRDVLSDIKGNKELCDIPVIILTTSENEQDVTACYNLGANTYVKKPVSMDQFYAAINKLTQYWFDLAVLPQGSGKIGGPSSAIFKF